MGGALLHAVVAWARDQGASALTLGVRVDSDAMRLYRRVGFQPVGPPEPLRTDSAGLAQPMRLALDRS